MTEKLEPIHPGEILRADFMEPLGLSARALALRLNVPPNRVTSILRGERGISGDTALRFARAFRTTPEFWMNLQQRYDLDIAQDQARELETISPFAA